MPCRAWTLSLVLGRRQRGPRLSDGAVPRPVGMAGPRRRTHLEPYRLRSISLPASADAMPGDVRVGAEVRTTLSGRPRLDSQETLVGGASNSSNAVDGSVTHGAESIQPVFDYYVTLV